MVLKQAQKKREIRTRYLSHNPGLRTCLHVKISNFEAHADMNIIHLRIYNSSPTSVETPLKKGDAYKHIPRTSTIASSATWIPSVRSLDCSDEASE